MRAGQRHSLRSSDQALLFVANGVALGTLVVVALRQFGVLKHLPDPPSKIFASDRITMSSMARPLGVPDSLPGLLSYGATLALVVASRKAAEPENARPAGKILGLKLLLDGTAAGVNAVRQVVKFRKLCSWCTGTALATAVMVYAGRRHIANVGGSWQKG